VAARPLASPALLASPTKPTGNGETPRGSFGKGDDLAETERCSITIVVPVFNEEDSLPELHQEIGCAMESTPDRAYEVILVDDGSTDGSAAACRALQEADPEHVRVIVLRRNFGQTAAMAAGFDAAAGQIIVPMDADLQNDPGDIARLIDKLDEGYDVVSGWRAHRQDKALTRRLPSRLANMLISWVTGVHLHDYGCTLKAYRRDVVEHMNLYGELHRFLPALASWAGAKVAELTVNHRPRRFGQSKYGVDRTIRVLLDLITVKFLLSYSTKPMQVFGKWGFFSMGAGVLAGLLTLVLKVFANKDVTGNPWMYASMLLLLGGLQLICMGLLGEMTVRTYYEGQHKPIYTVRERLGWE
jgi:glycosyltransferase involved in cell wall biosynthesis